MDSLKDKCNSPCRTERGGGGLTGKNTCSGYKVKIAVYRLFYPFLYSKSSQESVQRQKTYVFYALPYGFASANYLSDARAPLKDFLKCIFYIHNTLYNTRFWNL